MPEFTKLLQLLEKELKQQEQLLKILSEERAAIVKLNCEKIEQLKGKKNRLLEEGFELENARLQVISHLTGKKPGKEPTKLNDLVQICSSADLKDKLMYVGSELRKAVLAVQAMNNRNAELIYQSLGVINATISIICSAPQDSLPTYSPTGVLAAEEKILRKGRVLKEA